MQVNPSSVNAIGGSFHPHPMTPPSGVHARLVLSTTGRESRSYTPDTWRRKTCSDRQHAYLPQRRAWLCSWEERTPPRRPVQILEPTHPGGISYDGANVWVPVAQYRPNSSAIIYRVDASSLAVSKQFEVNDHIGGIVLDQTTGRLIGNNPS
jgi:hypothetical protein